MMKIVYYQPDKSIAYEINSLVSKNLPYAILYAYDEKCDYNLVVRRCKLDEVIAFLSSKGLNVTNTRDISDEFSEKYIITLDSQSIFYLSLLGQKEKTIVLF